MADVCNLCAKAATLMCQRCNESYCSTNCQILDWRAHKKVCFQMPTLVPIKDANILTSRLIPTELNGTRTPTDNNKTSKRPFARNPLKISSDETSLNRTTDLKSSGIGKAKSPSVIDFTLKPKNASTDIEAFTKSNVSQCSKASTRAAPWETSYHYPENVFFEILVQFIEPRDDSGIAWVTELKYESPLRKLLAEINRNIDINSDKCSDEEIYVGALIAAPFDNLYYRAKVVEVVEALKMVVVHLIDYGNQLELSFKDLRSPIPIMRNLNAYAFRIRLGKQVELETILTIRVVGIEPNGVAIIEEKVASLMDSNVMPATLKTDDFLTNPTASLVKISKNARFALLCICNETVKAQLQEMDNLLKADSNMCIELEKPPKNGDYVIASVMNCWSRSIVIGAQHKHFLVYTIDLGRIFLVQEVLKIPQKFAMLPMQIFAIEIKMILTNQKDLMNQLLENETIYIKAQKNVKAADGRVPCYIQTSCDKNIAEVEAFNYSLNSKEISLADWVEPLVSGSEIYITNVVSHDDIFISSVCSKFYPKLFTSAAEECELLEKNDKEQIVLAKVENEYFRAKILETTKGDDVKVLNVDTGHMATVSACNIRKPNLFVQSCPYNTRRVKLMYLCNVSTPYANNKAVAQLERCQQNGAEFILKVDQDLELGIELLLNTPSRESLNKQLLPMLFEKRTELVKNTEGPLVLTETTSSAMTTPPPSPKITESQQTKQIYSLKDLKMIPITCGDGVTIMVLDASTFAKQGYVTGCDYTAMDFIEKLEKEYLPKVDKHCAAPNNTGGYCPTVDEICLAVFESDKNWYRALCLQQMKEDTFCVMFLDYGNISSVHKSNIRPITPELMFPSNANMCSFENLPENVTPKMCEKFNAAIQANPIIKAKVTRLEQDSYLLKLENMENYF